MKTSFLHLRLGLCIGSFARQPAYFLFLFGHIFKAIGNPPRALITPMQIFTAIESQVSGKTAFAIHSHLLLVWGNAYYSVLAFLDYSRQTFSHLFRWIFLGFSWVLLGVFFYFIFLGQGPHHSPLCFVPNFLDFPHFSNAHSSSPTPLSCVIREYSQFSCG